MSIVQRTECLLHIDEGRGHRGYDGGLGAAAKRVLEYPGQLALSVTDMHKSRSWC